MRRKLTNSDVRLLEIYRAELKDAREIESKNTTEMPRLSGYIDSLRFCISHIISDSSGSAKEGSK